MLKETYYYIDESGGIDNDSHIFIHGCIKTDTPRLLSHSIDRLIEDEIDIAYFKNEINRIREKGFHATEDHPDVRAEMYKLLPYLNCRINFTLINKKTQYFSDLQSEKTSGEIFKLSLERLLNSTLSKKQTSRNVYIFESIDLTGKPLNKLLSEFFNPISGRYNIEYRIAKKGEEENLAIVDYFSYVLNHILNDKKSPFKNRMDENFDLFREKIASIYLFHKDQYFSRKQKQQYKVTLDNLLREYP